MGEALPWKVTRDEIKVAKGSGHEREGVYRTARHSLFLPRPALHFSRFLLRSSSFSSFYSFYHTPTITPTPSRNNVRSHAQPLNPRAAAARHPPRRPGLQGPAGG